MQIEKVSKDVSMKWLKAPWRKIVLFCGKEETPYKRHKLVKDIALIVYYVPNLEVEEKDLEEILETHGRELMIDELKNIFHQQCEIKEGEISFKIKRNRNRKTNYDFWNRKNVFPKLDKVRNVVIKCN